MTSSLAHGVRITDAKDYAHVFKKGFHTQSRFWKIIASDSGKSFSRLGLAISKKQYKRAVDRNLFKRLARETFRNNQNDLESVDFVIMVKKSACTDKKEITKDLLTLMKNAKSKEKSK
jgi:ribonuclease P protein component